MVVRWLPCALTSIFYLVLVCGLFLSTTNASNSIPGVKGYDNVDVWDNSNTRDVWARTDEYFEFRKYVLSKLSDMGFLDVLLKDLKEGKALRVINGIGAITGIAVTIVAAVVTSQEARSLRGDDEDDPATTPKGSYTLEDVLSQSMALVQRTLKVGPLFHALRSICKDDINVLNFFRSMDERFDNISLGEKAAAVSKFHSWVYNLASTFFENLSDLNQLVYLMETKHVEDRFMPTPTDQFVRLSAQLLLAFPQSQSDLDHLQRQGGLAEDGKVKDSEVFFLICTHLELRSKNWSGQGRQAQAFVANTNSSTGDGKQAMQSSSMISGSFAGGGQQKRSVPNNSAQQPPSQVPRTNGTSNTREKCGKPYYSFRGGLFVTCKNNKLPCNRRHNDPADGVPPPLLQQPSANYAVFDSEHQQAFRPSFVPPENAPSLEYPTDDTNSSDQSDDASYSDQFDDRENADEPTLFEPIIAPHRMQPAEEQQFEFPEITPPGQTTVSSAYSANANDAVRQQLNECSLIDLVMAVVIVALAAIVLAQETTTTVGSAQMVMLATQAASEMTGVDDIKRKVRMCYNGSAYLVDALGEYTATTGSTTWMVLAMTMTLIAVVMTKRGRTRNDNDSGEQVEDKADVPLVPKNATLPHLSVGLLSNGLMRFAVAASNVPVASSAASPVHYDMSTAMTQHTMTQHLRGQVVDSDLGMMTYLPLLGYVLVMLTLAVAMVLHRDGPFGYETYVPPQPAWDVPGEVTQDELRRYARNYGQNYLNAPARHDGPVGIGDPLPWFDNRRWTDEREDEVMWFAMGVQYDVRDGIQYAMEHVFPRGEEQILALEQVLEESMPNWIPALH